MFNQMIIKVYGMIESKNKTKKPVQSESTPRKKTQTPPRTRVRPAPMTSRERAHPLLLKKKWRNLDSK